MQTKEQHDTAKRMQQIFDGLKRGYGLWHGEKAYDFKHRPLTLQHYIDHLEVVQP